MTNQREPLMKVRLIIDITGDDVMTALTLKMLSPDYLTATLNIANAERN